MSTGFYDFDIRNAIVCINESLNNINDMNNYRTQQLCEQLNLINCTLCSIEQALIRIADNYEITKTVQSLG